MKIFFQVLKGGVVGLANLIPGVSGGTMALILGIYERMIGGLNNISVSTVLSFFKLFTFSKKSREDFAGEMVKIDFLFLLTVFGGAFIAAVGFAKIMMILLLHFHEVTYAFFFGLVLPSVIVPFKKIKKVVPAVWIALVVAALVVVASDFIISDDAMIHKETTKYQMELSALQTQEGASGSSSIIEPSTMGMLFVSGVISISAMILPGVSGSFLLLLMGQYFVILEAVANRNIPYMGVFALGLVVGLLGFTKFLHFLLKNYHDTTMGFLTGLVAGSLWIIWPFKSSFVVGSAGVEGYPETIYLSNVLPFSFSPGVIISVFFSAAVAALLVVFMMRLEGRQEK
jgi:putative membrane protein